MMVYLSLQSPLLIKDGNCLIISRSCLIISESLPQMKLRDNTDYLISFNVVKTDQPYVHHVLETHCTCPSGAGFKKQGYCKHISALYQFINQERGEGKTDSKQTWHTHSEHLQNAYPHVEMNHFANLHLCPSIE